MAFYVAGSAFGVLAVAALAMAFLVFRHGVNRPVNRVLAAFLLFIGASALGQSVGSFLSNDSIPYGHWAFQASLSLSFGAAVLPLAFAVHWLHGEGRSMWVNRVWPWVALSLGAMAYLHLVAAVAKNEQAWIYAVAPPSILLYGASASAAVLLIRGACNSGSDERRRAGLFLGFAFLIPFLYNAARDLLASVVWYIDLGLGFSFAAQCVLLAISMATSVYCLVALNREWSRARGKLWLVAGLIIASGLFDSLSGFVYQGIVNVPFEVSFDFLLGPYAIWNAISVLMLAYVVLSGQVPGMNVAFRVGVSRSTIAAIFVAVFFIVSEAAQTFFGQESGNEYFGIAAAGLLVLGIAPLQRFADKVADTAIPSPSIQGNPNTRFGAYLTLLRKVLADGKVTAQEERALASAATAFGITPEEAFDMREEALTQP